MAQVAKKGALARARRLARRYGLTTRAAGAAALCVLVAALAVGAVLLQGRSGGVVVERTTDVASAGGEAGGMGGPDAGVAGAGAEAAAPAEPKTILVHVDGAVVAPGVYALVEGARANDAVGAAGGLTEDADTSAVNLASVVADGSKVHIPTADEGQATAQGSSSSVSSVSSSSATSAAGGLVNINTAGASELQTLSGVGEATARAIIEDRESNGPFSSPEDLMRVSGIGEKKYAKIKDHICV